jgi:hypothetical protein
VHDLEEITPPKTYTCQNEQFRNGWLLLLLHHSQPGHYALNVAQFLASKLICVIQHPP